MNTFYVLFNGLYNNAFSVKKVNLNLEAVFNSWLTKRLQKGKKNFTINFLNSKLTEIKRNIRPTNLYLKF